MARRQRDERQARRHRAGAAASPDAASGARGSEGGPLRAYLERNAPEVVAVTTWFDPGSQPSPQTVTIRFTGRRLGPTGRPKPGDRFVHDEAVEGIAAGCGPVAVTAKVAGVNSGEWEVEARVLSCTPSAARPDRADDERRARQAGGQVRVFPARWSWRRWRPAAAPAAPVRTCLLPFARPPAIVPGSWALLAAVGMALALATQALLVPEGLSLGRVLAVSLPSLLAGAVGAKLWFLVLHRRERRREGWCVQGLVAGVALVAPPLLALLHVPAGAFLDAAAPGMMFGFAVGRVGCFFTGCCVGRPSGSRWALWSSDRRVGARRLPAQLLESALALAVGLTALAVLLRFGPHHGMVFVAALAAYTLIRQALLRLREERRRSRFGIRLVAAAATAVLAVDLALFALV